MPGTLYIVATPIGNLGDLTYRAAKVLAEVAVIACEDTRQTAKLLHHYEIRTPTTSLHEHNERQKLDALLDRIEAGESIALVSDAGTPLISDPGFPLVREARRRGIPVTPLPGASALTAALSASGLPTDAFYFGGFLPPKSAARRRVLEQLAPLDVTLIFYEAPHRIRETLSEIATVLPHRPVVVARELSKLHEEFASGLPEEVAKTIAERGEITLLIGKADPTLAAPATNDELKRSYQELVAAGEPPSAAAKQIAQRFGLSKREAYKLGL
ncbi:MAG: 16S rRNA (cytidine(1402)-2'-O)-methyltransferase [Bryobacteraceae bacterium]|nr:16S rRNA (cytidine(1402)-2'-O)-methyltransferase [Bryobacteraceae bacterium]